MTVIPYLSPPNKRIWTASLRRLRLLPPRRCYGKPRIIEDESRPEKVGTVDDKIELVARDQPAPVRPRLVHGGVMAICHLFIVTRTGQIFSEMSVSLNHI